MDLAGGARTGRALVVAGLTMTMLAAVPMAALAGQPPDPFTGSYRSVDTDGSNQLLAFGGPSGIRAVILRDDAATVCGGAPAFVQGVGYVVGNTIFLVVETSCGNAANPIEEMGFTMTVGPRAGQLTDSFGVTWTRP